MINRDYLEEDEINTLKSVAVTSSISFQNYMGATMVRSVAKSSALKTLYNILLAAPTIAFAITKPFNIFENWMYYVAAGITCTAIPILYMIIFHVYKKEMIAQTDIFTAISVYETCISSSPKLRGLSKSEAIQYINDYIFCLDYLPNK